MYLFECVCDRVVVREQLLAANSLFSLHWSWGSTSGHQMSNKHLYPLSLLSCLDYLNIFGGLGNLQFLLSFL